MCPTNYGTNMSIKFGTHTTSEYFDIAKVDFYDAILGMPFLWHHGIILDFKDQGKILIGNEVIPTNLEVVQPEKEEQKEEYLRCVSPAYTYTLPAL
jgi:hypothetical protein